MNSVRFISDIIRGDAAGGLGIKLATLSVPSVTTSVLTIEETIGKKE